MKVKFIFFIIVVTFRGCNQQKNNSKIITTDKVVEVEQEVKTSKPIQKPKPFFVDSQIPIIIINLIDSMDMDLRLPLISDYDDYYFNGYEGNIEIMSLPFFCKGYFNSDSITDYSAVFVKDTTKQMIYGFISEGNSYNVKLISKRELVLSENGQFKTVTYNINTETNKILEGIDTIYRVEFESIDINDMFESSEYSVVWNEKRGEFVDLLFD